MPPALFSFSAIASASALTRPVATTFGAPSTSSLAWPVTESRGHALAAGNQRVKRTRSYSPLRSLPSSPAISPSSSSVSSSFSS